MGLERGEKLVHLQVLFALVSSDNSQNVKITLSKLAIPDYLGQINTAGGEGKQ